jgi:nickel-dependent lactate racemase
MNTPVIEQFGLGFTGRVLTEAEIDGLTSHTLRAWPLDGKSVLLIIPDGTRTAPIPRLLKVIHRELVASGRARKVDALIALGTHQPMNDAQIDKLTGGALPGVRVFNHEWMNPETFVTLGEISAREMTEISEGMLHDPVEIRINRLALEYDYLLVCGPVFPHEVVGFSGGNKYLFPGISGKAIIDQSHWLGALITNYRIIGAPGITPVRRMINRASELVPTPKLCAALVVTGKNDLAGLYFGTTDTAWAAAAELSAQLHVKYVERPYRRVLSIMPEMYDDIWTAAKGMYKLEPVIADGGEVVIYAPHITEFSYTHGAVLAEVGYHVRDYFVKQWDRFKDYPWGVLAHATHLRGAGAFDSINGEQPRIQVTLATGISAARCAAHNLGYLDPATIQIEAWQGRQDEGILVVPKAGEILYRLAVENPQKAEVMFAD